MRGSDVHVARHKLTKCEIHDMWRLYDKSYNSSFYTDLNTTFYSQLKPE